MTKILVLSPAGGWLNGADTAVNHQIAYLADHGHEVHLVVNNPNLGDFQTFLDRHQIKVHVLSYNWWQDQDLSDEASLLEDSKAVHAMIRLIKTYGIELAISNTANVPHLALAASVCRIPNIWMIHEFPEGEFAYLQGRLSFIKTYASGVLASSQVLLEHLAPTFSGLPLADFYPYSRAPQIQATTRTTFSQRLVFVSSISGDRKNALEALKIYAALKLTRPTLSLVFTGGITNTAYYETLQAYIKRHQLADVTFLNHYEDNWGPVGATDIILNTSQEETFGLTLSESIQAGLVTIASDNAGYLTFKDMGILDDQDYYPLGDIASAVALVAAKIAEFDVALASAKKRQASYQSLVNVKTSTTPLINMMQSSDCQARDSLGMYGAFFDMVAHLSEDFDEKSRRFDNLVSHTSQLDAENTRLKNELAGQVASQQAHIAHLEALVADKERHITNLENQKINRLYRKVKGVFKR